MIKSLKRVILYLEKHRDQLEAAHQPGSSLRKTIESVEGSRWWNAPYLKDNPHITSDESKSIGEIYADMVTKMAKPQASRYEGLDAWLLHSLTLSSSGSDHEAGAKTAR